MNAYLTISGALFAVVALTHVTRLLFHWPLEIGGWAVPLWVSWIGALLPGALSVWAFRLLREIQKVS